MNVEINWKRAESVLDKLLNQYQNNLNPYNEIELPQRKENIPEGIEYGSLSHALYLFFACNYMQGPINSDFAFNQLREVWRHGKEIFNPNQIAEDGFGTFVQRVYWKLVRGELHYNLHNIPKYWAFNAYKLYWYWQSDPRNLLGGLPNFDDLQFRLAHKKGKGSLEIPHGFKGFGPKMTPMLAYFYMDAGITDESSMPPPIDFHLLRIMTQCRLLTIDNPEADRFTDEYKAAARELALTCCEDKDVPMTEFAEALWLWSRDMCSQYPGNKMHQLGEYTGRDTTLVSAQPDWDDKRVREKYKQSCAECPIWEKCELKVWSALYYKKGKIRAEPRDEPESSLIDMGNRSLGTQKKLSF